MRWVLLVVVLLPGCFQADPVGPEHAEATVDFTFEPAQPMVDETVQFTPTGRVPAGDEVASWAWDFGDGTTSEADVPIHRFRQPGQFTVSVTLTTVAGLQAHAERTVPVGAADQPPGPEPTPTPSPTSSPTPTPSPTSPPDDPEPVPAEPTFACPDGPVEEPFWNHGQSDDPAGMLTWAVLKTGFRFVAVLEGAAAPLEYSIDGAPWRQTSPTSGEVHVYLLDGLPIGGTMCFRIGDAVHAVTLGNAMNAWDPRSETYVFNSLSLANEVPGENRILQGTGRAMDVFYDGTDGAIQGGRHIVLFGALSLHNSGWVTCYIAMSPFATDTPACNRIFDVIYTQDAAPGGAASTYLDAVHDPDRAIWMNWDQQGAPIALDDNGAVLAHELGHYLLAGMDLYVGDQACNDASLGISIMGSDRDATEFDDPKHPCPDASSIPGYKDTWSLMQERFPRVPDRDSINPGPSASPDNHVHGFHLDV